MRYPLSNAFTVASLLLFLVSVFFTLFERIPPSFGFLLIIISIIFIISSLVSIFPDEA